METRLTAEPADSPAQTPAAPGRILIVEDEQIVALDLRRRLVTLGLEVVGVTGSGDEAIRLTLSLKPDVVLLDVRLHGELDGIHVAHEIHRHARPGIIFVTGNTDIATAERAGETLPFNYILKPVRDRELQISVRAALHHHRLAEALRQARSGLEAKVEERTRELAQANRQLQVQIVEGLRTQAELRHARALAEAASRSRVRFFGNISHQIRTPMNGIVGLAEVLALTPLSTEQQGYLQTMHTCAGTLLQTIDELIEFSDLEGGALESSPRPFDFRELLSEIFRPIDQRARERGTTLTCDISPEVPRRLIGDSARVRQVVSRLLTFLVEQSASTELEITCDRLSEAWGRAYIHVGIRDTSDGVSPELQRRFHRAFRDSPAETPALPDLDLALAIPAMALKLIGGVAWLEAIPGLGNTVHCAFWLDVSPPSQA